MHARFPQVRGRVLTLLGAASLWALSSPAVAQDEPREAPLVVAIEGRVCDADGTPVTGAVVVSSAGGSAVSGSSGRFRLEAACPWGVSVEVTAVSTAGGRTATSSVRITPTAPTWSVGSMFLQEGSGCSPSWLPTFGGQPGVDEDIYALTVFDDGSGPALYAGGDFTDRGRRGGELHREVGRLELVGAGQRDEPRVPTVLLCGVRRRQRPGALRGRRLHDRGRRGGEQHREVGRLELVGAGQRGERPRCLRPRGVRRRQRPGALRGRRLHDRGRRGGEPHREVGRLELVGARQRDRTTASTALTVFDDGSGPALYAGGASRPRAA